MRCKKHYTDLSSAVGVCACCLRQRLSSLIAAQQQVQSNIQTSDRKHRNSENIPSPHFNSRKSDLSAGAAACPVPRHHHTLSDQQFYRTPQVGTTGSVTCGHINGSKKKRSFIGLISFTNVFRSRNRNPRGGDDATSSSWFSSIISGGRRRRKQTVCIDDSTITAGVGSVRRQHYGDRGMSPVRNADVIGGDEDESTESWRNTPRRTVRRGGRGGHVRNMSGLTFCLSPLVRASPNLQWNQKGLPPEVVFSGEIGGLVKPHLSSTKSFCANRSRKLVDYGRLNPNR